MDQRQQEPPPAAVVGSSGSQLELPFGQHNRGDEPKRPLRRRMLAGSKLGWPREPEDRVSPEFDALVMAYELKQRAKLQAANPEWRQMSPQALRRWEELSWLAWEARQKRAALALRQKQKEPPTDGGSDSSD